MNKPHIKDIALLSAAFVVTAISYYNFQSFKPKILRELREVKGIKSDQSLLQIPEMQDARELGLSETAKGRQVTLEVNRTPEDVRNFYKNVLTDRGWTVEYLSDSGDFLVDKYKNGEFTATVTISKEHKPHITVVGVNIRKSS